MSTPGKSFMHFPQDSFVHTQLLILEALSLHCSKILKYVSVILEVMSLYLLHNILTNFIIQEYDRNKNYC